MKIVYDISLLGICNGSTSGLSRVAEAFTRKIKQEKDCNLTFCTSLSFDVWADSRQYLESDPYFADIPFISQSKNRNKRRIIYNLSSKAMNLIHKLGLFQDRKLPYTLLNLLDYNFSPLDANDLKSQDIFHSPYHALPEEVKKTNNLVSFITVNDLIPITHPHFFGLDPNLLKFDKNFNLKEALDSIDKDTWVICVSHSTKNDLCNYLENKIDENKIFVIYSGASENFSPCFDVDKISLTKQKYGIPNAPYLLSLSTLEPRKNIEHTIRCFADLVQQEKIEDLSLVLAGNKGWNYEGIFQIIADNKHLQERIIITGYILDEDLAALYSGALVFVYPSFYEGFGLPPLEAMQCGTPVITSNTSSLPEVVGDAGIMLDPLDRDGLSQSILEVYSDFSFREDLSIKSIQQAKKFSWSKCVQETITAYKQSLGLFCL